MEGDLILSLQINSFALFLKSDFSALENQLLSPKQSLSVDNFSINAQWIFHVWMLLNTLWYVPKVLLSEQIWKEMVVLILYNSQTQESVACYLLQRSSFNMIWSMVYISDAVASTDFAEIWLSLPEAKYLTGVGVIPERILVCLLPLTRRSTLASINTTEEEMQWVMSAPEPGGHFIFLPVYFQSYTWKQHMTSWRLVQPVCPLLTLKQLTFWILTTCRHSVNSLLSSSCLVLITMLVNLIFSLFHRVVVQTPSVNKTPSQRL